VETRRRATHLVVVLLVMASAAAARAAVSPTRKCQAAAATAGRQLLGRSMALLGACQRDVGRGTLPPGTDCATDAATRAKLTAAAHRATQRLAKSCTDVAVASLAPAGDCDGATTTAALVTCLQTTHVVEAATLMDVVDPADGPLSDAALRCQSKTSQQARVFATGRLRLLQRCKQHPPTDLTPGMHCSEHPRTGARIEALRASSISKITATCAAPALAGPPCRGLATSGAVALCVLTAADFASSGALAAEFPHASFCGDTGAAVDARIDDLLAEMTVAEKLSQMHGAGTVAGGVWQMASVPRVHVPGLAMVDGPRGVSAATGTATTFPVGMARGATWDPALETQVGEVMGTEARARKADVLLAPTINMLRHPRWGRAQETYGEDTHLLGRMGVGFVQGVQRHVIANPKHFAANSIEDTRFSVDVVMNDRALREVYLPHFRSAVRDGNAASVMTSYNKLNGAYAAENVPLVHDILKGDWGFQGFVESDWILGTRSTVPSTLAGLDIEMPSGVFYGAPLTAAVGNGTVPMATIDAAVRRILRAQLCFRLDTDPAVLDPSQVETPAHAAVALAVARESMVLLKNTGALPIDRSATTSLVVVGDLATRVNLGDVGSSAALPASPVTALAGITAGAPGVTITHVPSGPLSPGDQAIVAAADAAIVVAGLTSDDEGEGLIAAGDRESLVLPGTQNQLVADVAALNARTVVVLEGSGAVTMPWLADVEAVVMAWYPGQSGGTAIADVLFGDVVPSGKLPMTFPQAEVDLPPFDNVSLTVPYDLFHGYRWIDRNGTVPLFPFGFGLSYTTFQFSNLTVSSPSLSEYGRVRVTADVTNTGAVTGAEVAQLYVGYQGSAVDRAVNDLKGFTRVQLAPGETKTVVFDLRAADLAYWDTTTDGWLLEPITYALRVGSSSRDLPLEGAVTVAP
jgi:beta-glucosidase